MFNNKYVVKLIEFIKFSIVGFLMTILGIALFWLFNEILNINYVISNIISYIISVILSYFINAKYTFKEKNVSQKNHLKNLISFIEMKLILLALDSIFLVILVEKFMINKYLSKIILTIFFLIVSYPITRYIVKRKNKKSEGV